MQLNNGIMRAGSEKNFVSNILNCNINVSDICNFSCSYCINRQSRTGGRRVLDKRILSEFVEDIAAKNYAQYDISVAGGEPLIYPHVIFLVRKISESLPNARTILRFATNASMLPRMHDSLFAAAAGIDLRFAISVHLEQINIVQFAAAVAGLPNKDKLLCKILLSPGKLGECEEIISLFGNYGIKSRISVVSFRNGSPVAYSDAELAFIGERAANAGNGFFHEYANGGKEYFNLINWRLQPDKFNYFGMNCMAGMNSLRLGPDGVVTPCFGFMTKNREAHAHNLAQTRLKDIAEFDKPCVCPVKRCCCGTYLQTPKWRGPEYAPEYLRQ